MAEPADDLDNLLAAVGRRDVAAFRALYDATAQGLRAYAQRWLKSTDLADDILQLTYLHLWEKAPDRDPTRGSALGWMLRICRNVAIDEQRRRAARTVRETEFANAHPAAGLAASAEAFGEIVALLDPDERSLCSAIYLEGLTHVELAERTGQPLGTTKSRIRRALNKVRRSLTEAL